MADVENKLKRVTDFNLIKNILSKSQKNNDNIFVWVIENDVKKILNFSHKAVRKVDGEYIIKCIDQVQFDESFPSFVNAQKNINLWIPSAGILFQSKLIKKYKNNDILLEIPKMIAQVERRKDLRLRIEENQDCHLKFKHESKVISGRIHSFDKHIHDISAGGISTILTKGEADYFNIGDIVKPVSIWIGDVEIKVKAEVVNLITVSPNNTNGLIYTGCKLCLKYLKIGKQDHDMIETFVFKYTKFDLNAA